MSEERFFQEWLKPKLRSLGFDEDVFGNYIMGILTSDESQSEKRQTLEDTLSGATDSEVSIIADEICENWTQAQEKGIMEKEKSTKDDKNIIDEKLTFIMEKQAQSVKKSINSSESEKKLKEAILAQYAHVSDGEEEEDFKDSFENSGTAVTSIPTNTNVHAVINAEKELREKAKADYEKRKAQDKQNKEKQKQKQQERRDKERKRTQKNEHRR